MKKYILSLIYFIALVVCSAELFGQTAYYVGTSASGSGNGSSWANKDLYTDNFWGSLSAGDTLFIDGGSDSLVYSSGFNVEASGSWDSYIYMLPGKFSPSPSGHSGRVIIENGSGIGIYFNSQHWWYVKGLEVRNTSSDGIKFHYTSRHIVIDSVDVWQCGGFGIYGNGASCGGGSSYNMDAWDSTDVVYDITIKNSFIHSFRDEWPNTDDMIQFTCARDIKIYDNLILNNNLQSERTGEHIHQDDIQTFCTQGLKIYNNILVIDSAAMGHNLILATQSRDGSEYSGVDECIVYNNLIYHGGHLESGGDPNTQHLYLRWYGSTADMAPTYIFHNTFVWANGSGADIEMQRKGIFKNNIMYHDGTWGRNPSVYGGSHVAFWTSGGYDFCDDFITQVDSQRGNLMWFRWTTNNDVDFGTYRPNFVGDGGTPARDCDGGASPENWAGWTTTYGGDGVNENPLFVDTLWDDGTSSSFVLESNSPAIDAGEQSAFIESFLEARGLPTTDFFGNPRDANWDIGAFEFQQGIADSTANISFTTVNNAELNSYHIGIGVLSDADTTFWVLSSPDSFDINYPFVYDIQADTAHSGDTVKIPCVASNLYSTTVTKTIKVSGVNKTFSVTTKADPSGQQATIGRFSDGKIIRDSTGIIIRLKQ